MEVHGRWVRGAREIWLAGADARWQVRWGVSGGPWRRRWFVSETAARSWVAELKRRDGGEWSDVTTVPGV